LNDTQHIYSLMILVPLDDEVRDSQRKGLIDFVTRTPARDASELSTKAYASTCQLAGRLSGSSVLGAHAALWNARGKAKVGTS
jgi:hypothetical protein